MVSLFFYVNNKLLLFECPNDEALVYGDFLNYKESHFDIWNKYYYDKYYVDYDYYPRGRVVYNTKENMYYIYIDQCLEGKIDDLISKYKDTNYKVLKDFHYKCHKCNKDYVL